MREFELSISRLKGMTRHMSVSELNGIMEGYKISEDRKDKTNKSRKEQLMSKFILTLNTFKEDEDKQNEMLEKFNESFIDILRNKNRVVGINYLGLTRGSLAIKAKDFVSKFYDNKYHENKIFEVNPRINKLDKVFHNIISDSDDNIKSLEICYVIAYRTLKDIENGKKENHLDYIRVVFDIEQGKSYYYMGYPHNNIERSIVSTPYSVFNELKKGFQKQFNVSFSNPDTEKQVFEIYKMYTEKNEKNYTSKLDNIDENLFYNFYYEIIKKLNINSNNDDLYINRIKNVFIRAVIDNKFQGFIENVKKSKGYITGFVYRDLFGGSVTGKDGAGKNLDRENTEINPLQASDTYFDTKDTIYLKKQLFSVKLCLKSKDGIIFNNDVRISSCPDILMIHFKSTSGKEEFRLCITRV